MAATLRPEGLDSFDPARRFGKVQLTLDMAQEGVVQGGMPVWMVSFQRTGGLGLTNAIGRCQGPRQRDRIERP